LFADLFAIAGAVSNDSTTADVSRIGARQIPVAGVIANTDAVPQKKARPLYVAGVMPDHDTAAIALEAAESVPGGRQRDTTTG
jgi:hypothetical protein